MEEVTGTLWYKNKLTSIFGAILGLAFMFFGYHYYQTSKLYNPLPQQVILNIFNQPVGEQDLMIDTHHNPQYRKTTSKGETAADFLKNGLLTLFTYTKEDLESGGVLSSFKYWCSEDEAENLYKDVFVNLGQQRIVRAQNGLVQIRIIGDLNYIGKASRPYESISGLKLDSLTHKFTGKIIVTAYGGKEYPMVYDLTALVQRALLQDKEEGYQIIELEMK